MTPRQQEAVSLQHKPDGTKRTHREIAEIMGIPRPCVTQYLKRAKESPRHRPPKPKPKPLYQQPQPAPVDPRIPRDIIEMVTSPEWLNDRDISPAQLAILKAIYGIPMTPEEREVFLPMTEGREPKAGGYYETTIIAGTGSGKTAKILAYVCVFEAITFDVGKLSPGEMAVVPLVAQDEKAANVALGYCEANLRELDGKGYGTLWSEKPSGSPGARAKEVVGGEIRVRKNLSIRTYPCKKVSTRGITAIAAGMDEFAFWRTEPNAYNADREIQRAIRSRRRAHTPKLRLVKITSPYGEEGIAWEDFQERAKANRLFVHAPTWVLNPALSRESMAEEEHDDPEAFARERGAQFGKIGGSYISGALVDSVTRPDRREIAPVPGIEYTAAMDVAFKGDLYVVGVGHPGELSKVIVDAIWWKQGSKDRPLDDDEVAFEMGGFLNPYGIDRIFGDQFADVPTKKAYQNLGITFIMEAQTAASNMQMFKNLKAAMRRKLIELPPDPMVRKDLTSLIQTKTPGSPIWRCGAPDRSGMHDDISKVIAMLNLKLMVPAGGVTDYADLNRGAKIERPIGSVPDPDDWTNNIMEAIL